MNRPTPRRPRRTLTVTIMTATSIAALAAGIGLAEAATVPILDDCTKGAPALRSCDFRERTFTAGVELAPTRVSPILDNCSGAAESVRETFRYNVSIGRTITTEQGTSISIGASPMEASLAGIAVAHSSGSYQLIGDGRTVSASETLSALVKPGNQGFFMFAPLVGQSAGFLDALYTEPVDGSQQQFFPARDADAVKANFPQLLQDGRPDGYMFLRNVPCGGGGADIAGATGEGSLPGQAENARFGSVAQFTDERVQY